MNSGGIKLTNGLDTGVSPDDYMDDTEFEAYLKDKDNNKKIDKHTDRKTELKNVSIKDWLLTILLINIPFIGLIPCLYMMLSNGSSEIKKQFCKAWLIYQMILFVIVCIFTYTGVQIVATIIERFLASIGH